MRTFTVAMLLITAMLSGCAEQVLHERACTAQKDGYLYCRHYVEFSTEPICNGSCPK